MNTTHMNSAKTELTIIIPTYNEKENILKTFYAIDKALKETINWKVLFVDDNSPDGTSEIVNQLSKKNPKVTGINRFGQRGLSFACIEGILASTSPYICIMDADLQHDETLLTRMLADLKSESLDVVVGSRYVGAGSTGDLAKHRVWTSKIATFLSNYFLKQKIYDPMSGYFMFPRVFFDSVEKKLSGRGFKLLLDMLITSGCKTKIKELPYVMRSRDIGESKLGYFVIQNFLLMLIEKLLGKILPIRFVLFTLVGFTGLFVHFFVLWLTHIFYKESFIYSQIMAVIVAMTSNYFLNNHFTYHDKKLIGSDNFRGLINFYCMCSLGAFFSIFVANYLYIHSFVWWLAGLLGAATGAVWNFLSTAIFTWGDRKT